MSGLLPRDPTGTNTVSAENGNFTVLNAGAVICSGALIAGSISSAGGITFATVNVDNVNTKTANGNLTVTTTGAGKVDVNGSTFDSSGTLSIASGADFAVATIVDQGAGVTIACTGNTDIAFDPGTTGRVVVHAGHTMLVDTINPNTAGAITIASTSNGNVALSPNGTGTVAVAAAKTLTADTINPTTAGAITLGSTSNGNVNISPNGTGKAVVAAGKILDVDAIATTTTNGNLTLTTTTTGNISLNGATIDSGGVGITISTLNAPAASDLTLNAGSGAQRHIFLNPTGTGTVQVNPGFSTLSDTLSNSTAGGALALTTRSANANITITPNGSGVVVFGKGIQLPTSGGTVGTLATYEQNTSQSLTFSGPIANTGVNINVTQIGNLIGFRCTSFAIAANGVNTALVSTAINSRWRPTVKIRTMCSALSNSAAIVGIMEINSTGVITIATSTFGNLATTGNLGLTADVSFSYIIV